MVLRNVERSIASRPAHGARGPCVEDRGGLDEDDHDLLAIFAIAWLASALRVAGAFYAGGPFGVEATLAFVALLVIPLAFRSARASRTSR